MRQLKWGIAAGVLADRIFADPQRHHPVAYFGSWVSWLERRMYRDSVPAGAAFAVAAVTPPVVASVMLHRVAPQLSLAVALWAAIGGTSLERTGMKMAAALEAEDLEQARSWVPWLCSRDPQLLDAPGMARAAVESVAENTSDATIAPLVFSVLGTPAVVAHRCINTLDAMVGYRSERYERFGKASAIADDVLAWLPARVTALTHTAIAATRGRGKQALRAWREDAPAHPSPNAGPVEATAAAALGVQLGGETVYSYGVEQRPRLGTGPAPTTQTIVDAVALSRTTTVVVAVSMMLAQWVFQKRS